VAKSKTPSNTRLQTDRAPSGVLHRLGTVWESHSVAWGWTRRPGPGS
jgi:hypothetical protein